MIHKKLLSLLPIIASVLLIGCSDETIDPDISKPDASPQAVIQNVNTGNASGSFEAYSLDGSIYTEQLFTNSDITVVNIWGTFCGPCIEEMPYLGELANKYHNIQLVGIVCDVYEGDSDGIEYAKYIVDATGANYIHLLSNSDINAWKLNEIEYVPTTLIIDNNGNILYETVGSRSLKEWEDLISQYIVLE